MSLVQDFFLEKKKCNCIKLFLDVLPKALLRCFPHKMFAPYIKCELLGETSKSPASQSPTRSCRSVGFFCA